MWTVSSYGVDQMFCRRSILTSVGILLSGPALTKRGGRDRSQLPRFGGWIASEAKAYSPGPTFADNFNSFASSKWFYNSFDEGGDALWTNDPSLTPLVYNYTGGSLHLALLKTPPGHGISRRFISGIMDTWNAPNHFGQQYGYFEVVVAVNRCVGLVYECNVLSPYNWPPSIRICRIWTDADNVIHADQFVDGHDAMLATTDSTHGFDASQEHSYGLNWTASTIELYRDRALVGRWANPGGAYTNGDPMYTKMHCNANWGPTATPVIYPAKLPAYAHVRAYNVWPTKPF